MSTKTVHILVVEDDESHAELIRRAFEGRSRSKILKVVKSLREARDCLEHSKPDLVITDLRLGDGDGIELVPAPDDDNAYPLMVMTSYGDEKIAVEALKAGALDYVVKSKETLADMPHIAERAQREWEAVSRRRRAERAMQFTRFSVDHAADAVYWIFGDARFFDVNEAACRSLGYSREELLTKTVYDIKPEFSSEKWLELWKSLKDSGSVTFESIHRTKRGNTFPVEITANYLTFGNSEYVCAIVRDITERKHAEEALRESEAKRIEALRQSDALKSALLSSVSHELRTPLTSIKASVSNLLGQGAEGARPVREEFLQEINSEIDYLTRLVENLLDMSRVEAGTLVPQCEWHPFEELVEGAVRRMTSVLEPHPLEVQLDPDLPMVFVDAVEIQQVLVNLLDNAAKFSPATSPVRIEASLGKQQIEIRVIDNGEGILSADAERIFERFYRVPVPGEQSNRGSGLGLSICKGFVEAHGGRIWAESTKGGGATIAFSLPLRESPPSLYKIYNQEHPVQS